MVVELVGDRCGDAEGLLGTIGDSPSAAVAGETLLVVLVVIGDTSAASVGTMLFPIA